MRIAIIDRAALISMFKGKPLTLTSLVTLYDFWINSAIQTINPEKKAKNYYFLLNRLGQIISHMQIVGAILDEHIEALKNFIEEFKCNFSENEKMEDEFFLQQLNSSSHLNDKVRPINSSRPTVDMASNATTLAKSNLLSTILLGLVNNQDLLIPELVEQYISLLNREDVLQILFFQTKLYGAKNTVEQENYSRFFYFLISNLKEEHFNRRNTEGLTLLESAILEKNLIMTLLLIGAARTYGYFNNETLEEALFLILASKSNAFRNKALAEIERAELIEIDPSTQQTFQLYEDEKCIIANKLHYKGCVFECAVTKTYDTQFLAMAAVDNQRQQVAADYHVPAWRFISAQSIEESLESIAARNSQLATFIASDRTFVNKIPYMEYFALIANILDLYYREENLNLSAQYDDFLRMILYKRNNKIGLIDFLKNERSTYHALSIAKRFEDDDTGFEILSILESVDRNKGLEWYCDLSDHKKLLVLSAVIIQITNLQTRSEEDELEAEYLREKYCYFEIPMNKDDLPKYSPFLTALKFKNYDIACDITRLTRLSYAELLTAIDELLPVVATDTLATNLFLRACASGDETSALMILENYCVDINRLTHNQKSALHFAVKFGLVNLLENLLGREELDINVSDRKNNYPIFSACMPGRYELGRMILQSAHAKKINESILISAHQSLLSLTQETEDLTEDGREKEVVMNKLCELLRREEPMPLAAIKRPNTEPLPDINLDDGMLDLQQCARAKVFSKRKTCPRIRFFSDTEKRPKTEPRTPDSPKSFSFG